MAVVCLVGAGPRGTALLERLTVNAPEVLGEEPLVVHVLDPFPAGAGRIWRVEQPRLLLMNSTADDVALFPDEASVIHGPVVPAATLAEWVESHREELSADPETAEELDGFTAHSFASRALQGRFLRWSFQRVVDNAPEGVTVQVHQVRVLDVTEGLDGRQLVHLEGTDTPLAADAVVLAQGHPDTSPGPRERKLARFVDAHGLVHVPPGYTADLDPNVVPGRERVLVSGLGLAFVDWVVLLCETRGGNFGRGADGVLV
ncbi:MAG: FAD/NAD(P)-binding protein, partial [Mycobacteriaceae bacterium]